jgi:hypothetical protein
MIQLDLHDKNSCIRALKGRASFSRANVCEISRCGSTEGRVGSVCSMRLGANTTQSTSCLGSNKQTQMHTARTYHCHVATNSSLCCPLRCGFSEDFCIRRPCFDKIHGIHIDQPAAYGWRAVEHTISNEMTAGRHSRGPEYSLLPQERNRFRENPQHILVFCTFGGGG